MPRADTYGAYYRESRARLLHQVYAYVGNTEVAQRALADAYVAAGHHWRKLANDPNKDAWMRVHAFRATGRAQNRARKPWYESAMSTADSHRSLLTALTALEPRDRTVVILRYLVGLDLGEAARELGISEGAVRTSLETSMTRFAGAGINTDPAALAQAIDHLSIDLRDEPLDNANRLRREGNRRRRSHMLLAGMTALALAIGAGAVTAAQTGADQIDQDNSEGVVPAQPTGPPPETFSADDLAPVSSVSELDPSRRWKIVLTSSDFGADQPVTACLPGGPSEKRAEHYWVRTYSSGGGSSPTQAAEALEVAETPNDAKATYDTLVDAVANCRMANRELVSYQKVTGVGDQGSMYTLRYVVGDAVWEEQVTLVRTGNVVVTWAVRPTPAHPIRSRDVVKLAGGTTDDLCAEAKGSCSMQPYLVADEAPPPTSTAPGYLDTIDLPVFAGLSEPWVATAPKRVVSNPSSTDCDDADFTAAGADRVTSRAYVVPDAPQLAAIFGISETIGTFGSEKKARKFVTQASNRVDRCEDRQPNASVKTNDEVDSGKIHGRVWRIDLSPSENTTLVFRVALLRVGSAVTEVTFTPSETFDLNRKQYLELADRAGQRLEQLTDQ